MLFCCKEGCDKLIGNLKILYEKPLRRRHLVKFETSCMDESKNFSEIISDENTIHVLTEKNNLDHFGLLLSEDEPFCPTKFNDCEKNNDDKSYDIPKLKFYDRVICTLLCCNCGRNECVSNKNCNELLSDVVETRQSIIEAYNIASQHVIINSVKLFNLYGMELIKYN
jgi:hypothetical protein